MANYYKAPGNATYSAANNGRQPNTNGQTQGANVLAPNPRAPLPKPGHWRVSGMAKLKPLRASTSSAVPGLYGNGCAPGQLHGVATTLRSKQRMPRAQVRQLIAAGVLPPTAMPSRGGRK